MQLNTLIGKKTYQKHGFLEDGTRVPLTAVVVAGNIVTQIKTAEKEGYNSIQLGINAKKKANKAILGHVNKAISQASKNTPTDKTTKPLTNNITPKFFKEVRMDDVADFSLGTEVIVAEVFQAGDMIDVTGVSKGKGWAGGVKRYGFHGGPKTHGQSDRHRAPGSIGQGTTPGRVYRGKKMAGRMGSDTVTVKNLEIIEVTADGVLLIKGLVPGRVNGFLLVKKIGENKKYIPLYKEPSEEPVVEEVIEEVANDQVKAEEAAEAVVDKATSEEKVEAKAEALEPENKEAVANSTEETSEPITNTSEEVEAKEEVKDAS